MLEVEPDLLVMKDSRIDIAGANGFGYSIAEVAARAQTKHYCPRNDQELDGPPARSVKRTRLLINSVADGL